MGTTRKLLGATVLVFGCQAAGPTGADEAGSGTSTATATATATSGSGTTTAATITSSTGAAEATGAACLEELCVDVGATTRCYCRQFTVGENAGFAGVADVAGTGRNDLLFVRPDGDSRRVLMYPAQGQGLGAPLELGVIPSLAFGSLLGEFDGDGVLDVLFAGTTPWYVLRSNGAGLPELVESVPNGLAESSAHQAGDFDGDGNLDIIALAYPTDIHVWPGDGSGGFGTSVVTVGDEAGFSPDSLRVADVDGDGIDDALMNGKWHRGVQGGAGMLGPATQSGASSRGHFADADGDGLVDQITTVQSDIGGSPTEVSVSRNTGGGQFTGVYTDSYFGMVDTNVLWADMDDDGILDVVILAVDLHVVRLDANWQPSEPSPSTGELSGTVAAIADLTGDGSADLIVTRANAVDVWVAGGTR